MAPAPRGLWGIDEVAGPVTGSALMEYDFGLPLEPILNVPMREGEDPHGALTGVQPAFDTAERFMKEGVVENFCTLICDPD